LSFRIIDFYRIICDRLDRTECIQEMDILRLLCGVHLKVYLITLYLLVIVSDRIEVWCTRYI